MPHAELIIDLTMRALSLVHERKYSFDQAVQAALVAHPTTSPPAGSLLEEIRDAVRFRTEAAWDQIARMDQEDLTPEDAPIVSGTKMAFITVSRSKRELTINISLAQP